MKTELYFGVFLFACAVTVGVHFGTTSQNGQIWIAEGALGGTKRHPAAIKREIDFSRLDGAELITATQKRLVTAAKLEIHQHEIGIVLGHFATRGEDGQRRLACDSQFNRLTLRFEADGVADAGEKPVMVIDGPCRSSIKDLGSIEPIFVPYMKILEERPTDMDLSYDEGVNFKFENMGTHWPTQWNLQSVRLYNSHEVRHEVKISHRELYELRQQPFVMSWDVHARVPGSTHSH
jgi:hypothetical protein